VSSYQPRQLTALGKALDLAWKRVAPNVSKQAPAAEAARIILAGILFGLAKHGELDPQLLADVAAPITLRSIGVSATEVSDWVSGALIEAPDTLGIEPILADLERSTGQRLRGQFSGFLRRDLVSRHRTYGEQSDARYTAGADAVHSGMAVRPIDGHSGDPESQDDENDDWRIPHGQNSLLWRGTLS
jgi:hypothetical protein